MSVSSVGVSNASSGLGAAWYECGLHQARALTQFGPFFSLDMKSSILVSDFLGDSSSMFIAMDPG